MVTVRISLACTSPTRSLTGAFSTLLTVTEEDYAQGEHLRVAIARALLLGYGGPHHVLEARRVDGGHTRWEDQLRAAAPCREQVAPLQARLLAALGDGARATEGTARIPSEQRQPGDGHAARKGSSAARRSSARAV